MSGRLFLIDRGATVSAFPHHLSISADDSLQVAGPAASPSQFGGQRTLPLSFSSTSNKTLQFEWSFNLAAVDRLNNGKLMSAESHFRPFDRELLAVYAAI